ncbi:hypothetical protein GCM10008982_06710 [Anoxybacillus voinovskiensis]|nr:hypothetical protein GCM10008982_06710 [Anoxybacillus voinovskiensis]
MKKGGKVPRNKDFCLRTVTTYDNLLSVKLRFFAEMCLGCIDLLKIMLNYVDESFNIGMSTNYYSNHV